MLFWIYRVKAKKAWPMAAPFVLCAEHVRQLEGGSPFDNQMEVKS
jgi:hypothetical protein